MLISSPKSGLGFIWRIDWNSIWIEASRDWTFGIITLPSECLSSLPSNESILHFICGNRELLFCYPAKGAICNLLAISLTVTNREPKSYSNHRATTIATNLPVKSWRRNTHLRRETRPTRQNLPETAKWWCEVREYNNFVPSSIPSIECSILPKQWGTIRAVLMSTF